MTEAQAIAKYLDSLGYKQTSHKFREIARVDVAWEDLRDFFIRENFGDTTSSIPCLSRREQEDFYRRCYAPSFEVPEEVMHELRELRAVAR